MTARGGWLVLAGAQDWPDPGDGRETAWSLRGQGWTQLSHRPAREDGVEQRFVRGWVHTGGRARAEPDLARLIVSDTPPDLLVVFVASRGDYAARLVDLAEDRGWPPVLLHHQPGVWPWPGRRPATAGSR